jgi:glycosyltransferase involved in cell wall biosynthesis
VDDGSPAPVAEALAEIDDDRLRVLRVEHGGESQARNAGIAAASGRYLRFVDADDVFEPDSTAVLVDRADERTSAYAATVQCDEQLRPNWTMTCRLQGDVVEECLLGRFTVRMPSLLFPRAVVDAAGPWRADLTVSHDWDFVLRAVECAPVRGGREPATLYRRHSTSATSNLAAGEAGGRAVVDGYFARHPEASQALRRRADARLAAASARARLSRRQPLAATRHAVRAALLDPSALVDEARKSAPALLRRR